MTSRVRDRFPTNVYINFKNKKGQVALDQLRAIDRCRIIKVLGCIDEETEKNILNILSIMFEQ